MVGTATVRRVVAKNIFSNDLYEAKELCQLAQETIDAQSIKKDTYFNFICAIATVYKLGVENGVRKERARKALREGLKHGTRRNFYIQGLLQRKSYKA